MTEVNVLYCSVSVRYRVMNNSSKSFFRWIISEIFCCWKQQNELPENLAAVGYADINALHCCTDAAAAGAADVIPLEEESFAPRKHVNALEPYNPEVHGWRDITPPVMRSVKHSERATRLVTAIRMSGLQDTEILGVPIDDGRS